MKKEQGITIISLVVTIIILIILAGVSINLLLGQNGIITKAKEAKENMELAKVEEENQLNELEDYLSNYQGSGSQDTQINPNVVPMLVDAFKYSDLGITEENTFEEICQIIKNAYPEFPIGTTYNFEYTGNVQEWICETSGLYQLEVYGAQGGGSSGGKGGYSKGYIQINKGEKLYICCGGAGKTVGAKANAKVSGGYNGGGSAGTGGSAIGVNGSGGGGTHIATVTGTTADIGSSNKSLFLLIAGGGGGQSYNSVKGIVTSGGAGGGTTGGNSGTPDYGNSATGGTQTSGGNMGYQIVGETQNGSFGQGGNCNVEISKSTWLQCAGGGGGLYGGGSCQSGGGAGGSGYIGGVPEITYKDETYTPTTSNGANSGNGRAIITFVSY